MKKIVLALLLLAILPSFASEHGSGSAPAGPEPMQFTVNLGDSLETMRYLQVTIALEFAKPEAARLIAEIKPRVQHRISLLLSSENAENLQTTNGKQELQARLVKELNGLIDERPASGIKEAYFTSFIMQ